MEYTKLHGDQINGQIFQVIVNRVAGLDYWRSCSYSFTMQIFDSHYVYCSKLVIWAMAMFVMELYLVNWLI